ncbi:MAG: CPBP family glutamic-type intramembrane protease, partial [Clostridia bacterium]|nr:CPBP family glutamic-type intramembrane protease [Clostridia bacterium]
YLSFSLGWLSLLAVVIGYSVKNKENPFKRMALPDKKCILPAVLLFIGLFFGLSELNGYFINFLKSAVGYTYEEPSLPSLSPINFILTVITVCVMPALVEETVFRGILSDGLKGGNVWINSTVTGLCFALYHMNPAQTPYQFAVGFLFGYVSTKSGSILPSVVIHFVNNLLIVISYYFLPDTEGFGLIGALIGCIALVLFFVLTYRENGRKDKKRYLEFFGYASLGIVLCLVFWVSNLLV